jgi:1-acyl-sn-glycerol-3-phosphate acyltransferase
MKWIKKLLQILWRIWFFIVTAIVVILISPLLVYTLVFDKILLFNKIKRWAANIILLLIGFRCKTEFPENFDPNKQYMVIANHVSALDIFTMIKIFRFPFIFIGKKELSKLPIFGYFYKKTNVTVDRSSPKSKKEVYDQVQKFIKKGLSVVIYPEGKIPEEEILLHPFKNGAFRIAIEHNLPILPVVLYDHKRKFPYRWTGGSPGRVRIKVLPPIPTDHLKPQDMEELKNLSYTLLYNELMNDEIAQNF